MRSVQRVTLLLLILLLSGLACGCLGPRVYTDHDEGVDFARMERFAWLDPPLRVESRPEGMPAGDPFTHNTLLDKRVREAVESALEARGYREVEADEDVDFQLRYDVVSREVYRDSPIYIDGGYGYGYRRGYYGSSVGYSHSTSYQEGTLILDVIDPESHSIAWRGWAASRTRDGHIDAERVSRTVQAILEEFPPGDAREEAEPEEED